MRTGPSIEQVLHLLWNPSQGKLEWTDQNALTSYTLHLTKPVASRLSAGHFPVHSPLLRESSLVPFPPLTDMLKFSGYSRLSSGRKSKMGTTITNATAQAIPARNKLEPPSRQVSAEKTAYLDTLPAVHWQTRASH